MPKRIQQRRTKGWRKPEGCVYVGRPTKWGNPWTEADTLASGLIRPEYVREACVREFRGWLLGEIEAKHPPGTFPIYERLKERRKAILESLDELRGHDLSCWCPLDKECHADVLLELANRK